MGRHSRKGGSAPAAPPAAEQAQPQTPAPAPAGTGRRRRAPGGGQEATGTPAHGTPAYGTPAHGTPAYGTPAHGTPTYGYGANSGGSQGAGAYGTGAGGSGAGGTGRTGVTYGTGAYAGGAFDTPAHGTPGTPAHGIPAYRTPVRGGHPQHDEASAPPPGPYGGRRGTHRAAAPAPERADAQAPFVPGQRRVGDVDAPESEGPAGRGGLGRTLTGVAAAGVATVLAVVVAGQVADRDTAPPVTRAAEQPAERPADDTSASRSDARVVPATPAPAVTPVTYEQLMTRQFPIDPKLKGSGAFEAVPGFAKAPGKGRLIRYRIDVEKGIGLDAGLFADAVQKTLNDKRSWAGNGEMKFERISSGEPEFVITLASPGTTGTWCRKSGLDTTVDNVSCDSASTERVMINAFRWAQGSDTFGPKAMHAYRQMLINHEVGHRLGHSHVSCRTAGSLAPVMQQQTKSLNVDGIPCRPNPWVHPGS
ncbi:DUF3152 domain-containing protein [Streptomyces sp. LMG1-1-1.1]|uniref:DUF3152 domain-containing protein n=1 Tax=Streptomyces sp. LMG1-1-1.1 TaxID=3135245 RepID=UPI0034672D67